LKAREMAEAKGRARLLGWRSAQDLPRAIWTLGFVSLLMDVSSEMIHAILPVYLVFALGASMATLGWIEGVAEAIASIVKLFSGALSDWLGKRKLLAALGYGLAALSKPIFPLAGSVGWVAAARFLDRIGKGVRGAPRDALVADLAPPELRGAAFGLRQALDTVGAFVGPAIGVAVLWFTADRFRPVLWIACLPAVAAVALLVALVDEPEHKPKTAAIRSPLELGAWSGLGARYWIVCVIAVVFTLPRFSEAFLILRGQALGLPLTLAPLVLVVMNVVYALAAYPVGALSDRIGRGRLLGLGFALLVLADCALGLADGLALAALGVVLWGLHLAFTQGLLATLVADAAPVGLRGAAFGAFNFLTGLALLAANAIAGALWQAYGAGATFFAAAALTALALVAFAALRPREP
jgi:MFS family permease